MSGCAERFGKLPSLTAHLRNAHTGVQLDADAEQRLDIACCPVCVAYYRSGSLAQHQCRPARRPARPQMVSLGAQLARNPAHVAAVPLPPAPPYLSWPNGAPAGDRCWFLVPLIASLTVPDAQGGLPGFYAERKWQRWREHFSVELGARPQPLALPAPTPPTEAACVEFLRGTSAIACPVSDSCADHPFHSLLQVVDHINLRHANEALEAQLQDVKRCECGYSYLDTAVGKASHMRWCERLSLALSAGGLALAVPDSVSMLRLTCAVRVSHDNRRVELPERQLFAVEWGSAFGQHTQLCFYLASMAPDRLPGSPLPSAPTEDHGRRAVALKAELGPAANETQSLRDFTALAEPADTEVFLQLARSVRPVAVVDVNLGLPTFTLFFNKACDPLTPVTVLLRIGQHFQRLYAADLHRAAILAPIPALAARAHHLHPHCL